MAIEEIQYDLCVSVCAMAADFNNFGYCLMRTPHAHIQMQTK